MEKCKKCGGGLAFCPSSQSLKCEKCNTEYEIKKNTVYDKHDFEMEKETKEEPLDLSKMKSHCSSCGAVFSGETFAISDVCSYCGAHLVIDFNDGAAPDCVIPFAFDRHTAKSKFRTGLRSKWFVPSKFKKTPPENTIESIYIPAYLCDVSTSNYYTGKLYDIHRKSDGNTYKTYTNISGTQNVVESNLIVECSSELAQATLNAIKPYNIAGAYKFQPDFILGYSVEYFNRNLQKCKDNLKAMAVANVRRRILDNYSYDGVDYLKIDTSYYDCCYSKIILPTYRVNYKYKGKDYSTFMNGQTGKVGGNIPRSAFKITLFVLGAILGLGAIGYLVYLLTL